MKKGIYIVWGFNDHNANSKPLTGIEKKILAQIESLNIPSLISCKLIVIPSLGKRLYLKKFLTYLFIDNYRNYGIEDNSIDYIYIRRFVPTNYGLIQLLKRIKIKNPLCKILYEIPTYPYEKEHYDSIKNYVILLIDRFYRKKLIKYVDRVITLSNDDRIFGINTIRIRNGIKCSNNPVVSHEYNNFKTKKEINLIAVAYFSFWHGYERLIEGLYIYYNKSNTKYEVNLHFCGDGDQLKKYKSLVQKYNLTNHVKFYGALSGDDLTRVYNNCDIGICSLGSHRKNIYLSSELKSREYLARGLPIVSSAKVDCLPDDFEFCMYVPEDESAVNVNQIVNFYERVYINNGFGRVHALIRSFAEKNVDISKTMQPVIDYIINSIE